MSALPDITDQNPSPQAPAAPLSPVSGAPAHGVSLAEAARVWARVAMLSFGGPAGQIAVMHKIIIDERKWVPESRFLHALNCCMLLPGPEGQQLATYIGWLTHRTVGGLIAGALFILPGVIAIMALSVIYALWGSVGIVGALFFGLKAAVLAIVLEALVRISNRGLKTPEMRILAAASSIGIFFFAARSRQSSLRQPRLAISARRGEIAPLRPSGSHQDRLLELRSLRRRRARDLQVSSGDASDFGGLLHRRHEPVPRRGAFKIQQKGEPMKTAFAAFAAVGLLLCAPAVMAETDWSQVDAAIGKKAMISGTVHKYGLPRPDLHVTLDGVSIKPGLALGGWIAFEPAGHETMMMGDLVLTEPEVTPVMRSLLANGVDVTALHNHLLRASPATFYMHVGAHGDPVMLAKLVREALTETKTPFEPSPASAGEPPKIAFDTTRVDEALGFQGKNNGGVYQFSIPKADQLKVDDVTVAPAMGVANVINFQPTTDGKAAITGDFVATAKEVEPLLKTLQTNGIEVTALHNHMLDDEPRLFLVHFWANDDAVRLARALRASLDAVHAAARS